MSNLICEQKGSTYYIFLPVNNSSQEFLGLKKIQILDVTVEYKPDDNNVNNTDNSYLFKSNLPADKNIRVRGNESDSFKFTVKLINSPVIEEGTSFIKIRFVVTYLEEDEVKVEIINSDRYNKELVFTNTIASRGYSPYKIRLDSIYRPFFFNSTLLLLPENFLSEKTTNEKSKKCCGRLYYSIANGCSFRTKHNKTSEIYKIGDININLMHNDVFNLTIKDSFRLNSEMREVSSDITKGNTIEDVISIRECGNPQNNKNKISGFTMNGGMTLYKEYNGKHIYAKKDSSSGSYFILPNVYYQDNDSKDIKMGLFGENDENNQKDYETSDTTGITGVTGITGYFIDTTEPLVLKMEVKDYAPPGYGCNTISVTTPAVLFPDEINYSSGTVSFDVKYQNPNIAYLYTGANNDKYTLLQNIITRIGSINVNDDILIDEDDKWIDNALYYKSYLKYLEGKAFNTINDKDANPLLVQFKDDGNGKCKATVPTTVEYLVAIYHGSIIKDDNDETEFKIGEEKVENPFSYIKHTNKLTMIKIYKLKND